MQTKSLITKTLTITIILAAFFFFTKITFATTITVDTTAVEYLSDAQCSLPEAIANANDDAQTYGDCLTGSGTDTIEFDVSVSNDTQILADADGVYTITSPIVFNGLTQGNASCGTLEDLSDRDLDIELQGITLVFGTGSDGSSIQGLSILGGSTYSAIAVENADGFDLTCSNIGIDASGTSANVTRDNLIRVDASDNVNIGSAGLELAATNIIAGANSDSAREAIYTTNSDNFSVYGNWFGKGVGPSFNEFPASAEFLDICGITGCGGTDLITGVTVKGNDFFGGGTDEGVNFSGVINGLVENNSFEGFVSSAIRARSQSSNINILSNHIFNNPGTGISLSMDNATIQGNYIGTDETGTISNGNGSVIFEGSPNTGIVLLGSSNVMVGGSGVGEGNIISGNDDANFLAGIALYPYFASAFEPAENITIQGNYIGVAADGVTPLPNSESSFGVFILGNDVVVGGTDPSEYNIIQGGLTGVGVVSAPVANAVENISILGNTIYNNMGNAIDLSYDSDANFFPDTLIGPNPNDTGDADEGPYVGLNTANNLNHLLNYPEFTSYATNTTTTDIEYILDAPAGDYRIEFFQNSVLTDYGEGETFLDYQDITHTGSGEETFTINLPVTVGDHIAATATERNQATFSTFGATSEFSASATIETTPVVVTTTSRRSSGSSTSASRSQAKAVFDNYYAEQGAPSEGSTLNSGQCPANLMVTQNLKQGAVDGQYHPYTGGTVNEVALVQQHINRILANYFDQAAGPVDGIYGPLTKQGVQRLQQTLQDEQGANLGPAGTDGIVGPMTRGAINGSCGEEELQS